MMMEKQLMRREEKKRYAFFYVETAEIGSTFVLEPAGIPSAAAIHICGLISSCYLLF